MNKKLVALLVVILVLCSLGIVACDTHNHQYVEVAAKDATCTEKGNELYYTCSGCDQLFDADKNTIDAISEIAAKGHSATHVEAKDATCTDAGNSEYWYCSGCSKFFGDANCTTEVTLESLTIAANNHDYVEHAAVSATCTDAGNELYYTCENCSKIFDAEKNEIEAIPTIAASGHKYVEHSENVSSCTGTGNAKYYTCENCTKIFDVNKNEIEAIPSITPNGHGATHKVAQDATCTDAGHIEHWYCSACEKYFSDATCTQETTFDAVTIAAQGHKYVEHAAVAATCTDAGNELYYTCENCSAIFDAEKKEIEAVPTIAAKGHKYVEHAAVSATCTDAGNELYYTCESCSAIFDAEKKEIEAVPTIAAKGHKYVEHAAVSANCTDAGNELYYTCENCSAIFDAEKKEIEAVPTIAAQGHKYVEHAAVAATCTDAGNELYYTCENCSTIFDAEKKEIEAVPTIAEKGHTYVWSDPVQNVSVYKCECGDEKYSVTVSGSTRQLIDVESENVVIDVEQFGKNLVVKSVSLGDITLTGSDLAIDGTKVTVATEKLLGTTPSHGDGNVTISVAIGDSTAISVTLPVRVAYTIGTLEELEELYTVTDHETYKNPVVGGTVTTGEDGATILTPYWYVLTADIDGADRMGDNAEYGNSDESWYTSGAYKEGFIGVFDGQGHTIKNVTVLGHGFFGHVGRGTIQNVNFDSIELADGETTVIGKVMDATIINVKVSNVTVGNLSENSGILFYTQCFSATLKNVEIDISNLDASINVFCKLLDNSDMWGFDNSSFENVTIKAKHDSGVKLFAGIKLTDDVDGVTVSFVPFQIDAPVLSETSYYHTGNPINVSIAESEWYTVSGNGQTNIGTYTITVSLKYEGISWSDGSTDDVTYSISIVELDDATAKTIADKFNSYVSALNDNLQLPRDKATIESLLKEYNNLNPKVQQLEGVSTSKETLDKLKVDADKYTLMFESTDTNATYIYAGHNGYSWNGTISATNDDVFGKVFLLNVTEATYTDKKVADFQVKGFECAVKTYEYILFYIYNPFESDAQLGGYNTAWGESKSFTLAAKTWTLVKISTTVYDKDNLMGRFYILTAPEGQTAVGEWKVTSFWGYYDQETTTANVKVVTDAIDAIDLETLALTDEAIVVAARTAYDAADGFTKYNVPAAKLEVLVAAEAKIVELKDNAAAQAVIDAIDALADESSSESILAARASYDALTDAQKELVSAETLAKLVAAEGKIVADVANAFAAKVTALGTPVFPRDNDAVYALVAEYESLADNAKALLTQTKTTLDGYKTEADKWTELAVQFDSDKILNGLSGYDKYCFVINNPTDDVVKFYVAQDSTWKQTSAVELAVGSDVWTTFDCPKDIAEGHHIYLYGGESGGTLDFRAGNEAGWSMKIYGAMNDGVSETSVLSVGGGIDSAHGKVNDCAVSGTNFYILNSANATTLVAYADKNVYFYIYNPTDADVRFYATYDWSTNYTNIIMKANSWTKVCISDLLNDADVASKTTYFYAEGAADGSGWLMSDFFVDVQAAE